jgi:8-oxo-dGTP diphosphatase
MELPLYDNHGGSLLSFERVDDAALERDGATMPVSSVVAVQWGQQVLLGFNVTRQQWELPGGSVEPGESAHDAAIRELAEETNIRVEGVSRVASAAFTFAGNETIYTAAIFTVGVDLAPELIESDELNNFVWWDPAGELFDGLSPLDAEVARRCLPLANTE